MEYNKAHGFDTLTEPREKEIALYYTKAVPAEIAVPYFMSEGGGVKKLLLTYV